MTNSTRKKSVAAQFRSFRKSTKMTQRMLALCIGLSRREVIYIEQGATQPTLRHLMEFEALVERHKSGL